ncbi:roundabout1-like, partial [Tropilaelaps mercedesae]
LREEFIKVPSSVKVPVGGTAVLKCTPPDGLPAPEIEWLKEGVVVNVGSGPKSRFRLEGPGNLAISEIRATDQGGYVCKAENIVGIRETPPASLRVNVYNKPKLIKVPTDKTVRVSGIDAPNVRLECSAAGDPTPRIRWRKNGRELTSKSSLNTSANDERIAVVVEEDGRGSSYTFVEISDVRPDDQGNYTCEAENAVGRTSASAMLTVHHGPNWVVPPEDQQIRLWNPLVLRCEATGNPRPDVYWSRSSSRRKLLFPGNSDGRIYVDSHGTLNIKRVFAEDQGAYICTAHSVNDQITATAHVKILGGVPIIPHTEHPLLRDLFASPWLLLSLSATLCLILICVAVTILVLLRRMNTKTQSAVTEVPVAKGGTIKEPQHRQVYSGNVATPQTPMLGPYASTTVMPSALSGIRIDSCSYRCEETPIHKANAYPVTRGTQGAHELENLLHSGYSASSSSGTSSFEKKSGRSSRSSVARLRAPTPSPSPGDNTSIALPSEPIYSLVPEDDDAHTIKHSNDGDMDIVAVRNPTAGITGSSTRHLITQHSSNR